MSLESNKKKANMYTRNFNSITDVSFYGLYRKCFKNITKEKVGRDRQQVINGWWHESRQGTVGRAGFSGRKNHPSGMLSLRVRGDKAHWKMVRRQAWSQQDRGESRDTAEGEPQKDKRTQGVSTHTCKGHTWGQVTAASKRADWWDGQGEAPKVMVTVRCHRT